MKSWVITILLMTLANADSNEIGKQETPLAKPNSLVEKLSPDALRQRMGRLGISERHLLVQFGASNCVRCESMKQKLDHIASVYSEGLDVVEVDFEKNSEVVKSYGARVSPTYVLYEQGQEEPIFVGSFPVSRGALEAEILALLALSDDS